VHSDFDLCGTLRRIRRTADLSQRELAGALGISAAAVGQAEAGTRQVPLAVLARAAALAGLRLALVDDAGREVAGMADDTVRDLGRRRFPAHLDPLHSDDRPARFEERWSRPLPWYTFDRDRTYRDVVRRRDGTPDDHRRPQPGDSPAERRARRRAEALRRRQEEFERRRAAGQLPDLPDFVCTCPPLCAELDIGERPRHAPDCPCGCDVD
jgi:transcriptional regulator with XRE-family HTH domain